MDYTMLERFTAFEHLPPAALEKLASAGQLLEFRRRDPVFRRGDAGETALYLLAGEVLARYPDGREKRMSTNDAASRYPVGNLNPRPFDLLAVSKRVEMFSIDREEQDRIIALASLSEQEKPVETDQAVVVQETEVDPQWLFRMLQSPAFASMPADKLDRFMAAIEQVEMKAGDTVIRQGEPGDYYYIIQSGSVVVEREQGPVTFPIATLQADSAFGEEALLREDAVRNATVRMAEDGSLVRLHRDAFKALLEPAFLNEIEPQRLDEILQAGSHLLVDVRLQPEYARHHLQDSINIPLFQLRRRMGELPTDKPLLLICDSGVQSRVAAFILKEQGYDTAVLAGGLSRLLPSPENAQGEQTEKEN